MNHRLKYLLDQPTFVTQQAMDLLEEKGDAETLNANGESLLHRLVTFQAPIKKYNKVAITSLVKAYDVDINLLNGQGKTALQCLMDLKEWATSDALFLISLGAYPHLFDSLGQTLIHRLVSYDSTGIENHNLEAILTLVLDGIFDINERNQNGQTPLQYLLDLNTWRTEDALFLIDLGADPTLMDSSGQTFIHRLITADEGVVSDKNREAIRRLVESGKVAINIPNQMGQTPLQYLLDQPSFDANDALLLIQLGADIYSTNSNGDSLLYRLATSSTNYSAMIARLIQEYHVIPETLNTANKTPIDVALEGIKDNKTHFANISTLLENSNTVSHTAATSFYFSCPSLELMSLNKLLATLHTVGGSQSYELQGKVRDNAFEALKQSLVNLSDEAKLEKLRWARELPIFCKHRSHFFLATIGRTNTVIKIDKMISDLENSPSFCNEVPMQNFESFPKAIPTDPIASAPPFDYQPYIDAPPPAYCQPHKPIPAFNPYSGEAPQVPADPNEVFTLSYYHPPIPF